MPPEVEGQDRVAGLRQALRKVHELFLGCEVAVGQDDGGVGGLFRGGRGFRVGKVELGRELGGAGQFQVDDGHGIVLRFELAGAQDGDQEPEAENPAQQEREEAEGVEAPDMGAGFNGGDQGGPQDQAGGQQAEGHAVANDREGSLQARHVADLVLDPQLAGIGRCEQVVEPAGGLQQEVLPVHRDAHEPPGAHHRGELALDGGSDEGLRDVDQHVVLVELAADAFRGDEDAGDQQE